MQKTTSLLSALVLAGATLTSQAFAADISKAAQEIDLVNDSASFHALFSGNNAGNTFSDAYTLDTAGSGILSARLESRSGVAKNGLDITGFGLYSADGTLVQAGSELSTGLLDKWTLNTSNLVADNYYVSVSGKLLSEAAGKYDLNIGMAPVPEPETYAMLVGGLGLLGFAARRRNKGLHPA